MPQAPINPTRRIAFTAIALGASSTLGMILAQFVYTPARRHELRRLGQAFERAIGVQRATPNQFVFLQGAPVRFLQGSWIDDDGFHRYAPWSVYRGFYPGNPHGDFQTLSKEDAWMVDWRLDCPDDGETIRRESVFSGKLHLRIEPECDRDHPWTVALQSPAFHLEAGERARLRMRARADKPRSIQVALQDFASLGPAGTPQSFELDAQLAEHDWTSDAVAQGGDFAIFVNLAASAAPVEFELLTRLDESGNRMGGIDQPYYVEYRCDEAGYRNAPAARNPEGSVTRIACLGDSYSFGIGVPEGACFAAKLAKLLGAARPGQKFEVLNFGVSGSSPDQELHRFDASIRQIQPKLVVLTLCANDHLSADVDAALLSKHRGHSDNYARAVFAHFRQHGFSKSMQAVSQLERECEALGIKLVIGVFEHYQADEWIELDREARKLCREQNVLFVNPKQEFAQADLFGVAGMVYPALDPHPNGAAHAIYAQALCRALVDAGWVERP